MENTSLHFRNVKEWLHGVIALALIAVIAGGSTLTNPAHTLGATISFMQTDWSGGVTANSAVHPTNTSGWTQMSSSTSLVAGTSLTLATSSAALSARTDVTAYLPGDALYPKVLVDSNNVIHVLYMSHEYNASWYNLAYRNSNNWSNRVDISTYPASGQNMSGNYIFTAVLGPSDTIHVAYMSGSAYINYVNSSNWSTITSIYTGSLSYAPQTPSLAVASSGIVHLAYVSNEYNLSYTNIAYRNSSNWNSRTNITALSSGTTLNPSIAVDTAGTIHIAYDSREYNGSKQNVAYRNSSNWGSRVDVTTMTTANGASVPQIAVDSNNAVHMVYVSSEYTGNTVLNLAYRNSLNSWATSTNVTTLSSGGVDVSYYYSVPRIQVDSNGIIHVVYHSYEYNGSWRNIAYRNSSDWTVRTNVTTNTNRDSDSQSFYRDADSVIHVVYASKEFSSNYINIAYRNSSNWATRTNITSEYYRTASVPRSVVDANGVVHVVYVSYEYNSTVPNIVYRNSSNWSQRVDVTTLTSGTAPSSPVIAVDGTGVVHVAYASYEYNGTTQNVAYRNSSNWGSRTDVSQRAITLGVGGMSMVADASNVVHLTYHSYEAVSNKLNIVYRNSSNWTNRVDVTASATRENSNPGIAVSASGVVHIMYQSKELTAFSNVAYRNSSNWSARTDITTGSTNLVPVDFSMGMGPDGTVHAIYRSWEQTSNVYNLVYRNSSNWSQRTDITNVASTISYLGALAVDASGVVHIAYASQEQNGNYNVVYRNSTNWSARLDVTSISIYNLASAPTVSVRPGVSGVVNFVYTSPEAYSSFDNLAYRTYSLGGSASSGNLISSPYDAGNAANLISQINWDENSTLPSGTTAIVSLRTAATQGGLASAGWTDFTNATTNCTKAGTLVTCPAAAIPAELKDGSNDRWFQYKVALTAAYSQYNPSVDQVTVQYVVNTPPNFDTGFGTNGVSVSENTTAGDPNQGRIFIEFHPRDTDSLSGSANPGALTATYEYNIGGGWIAVNPVNVQVFSSNTVFSSGTQVTGNLPVSELSYTTYTAVWDAKSQIPESYAAAAQIRVNLNDNEAANNTAQATGGNFVLDTKNPAVSQYYVDAPGDRVVFSASDDSNLSYRFSNNGDLSSDGVNTSSSVWVVAGGTSVSSQSGWTLVGTPSYQTVYMQVRDIYGNTTTTVATAPSTPSNLDLKDISNVRDGYYREFIGWTIYSPTTTAPFGSYKVYRSADDATYVPVANITNVATNYYTDNNLSSSTAYYYKVAIFSSNGDSSEYSNVVSDLANGQGGTDFTPPSITNVVVTSTQSTWAKITWDTDEVSNSVVEYSMTPSRAYDSSKPVDTMVTSHDVTVTGLTPNTTYYFRVKSVDPLNNIGTNDNNGSGYTIITTGGPSITNVTASEVSDVGATIFWNTNTDSNSYVVYSTNHSLSNAQTAGNDSLVGSSASSSLYQHKVALTGLTSGLTYYYYVKSTDGDLNLSTENNGGAYYSFRTTTDQKAPVISSLQAPVLSTNSAVVTWNTDEAATTQLFYGLSSSTLDFNTAQDSTLSVSHVTPLTSLSASTPYFYKARSRDAAGNSADSTVETFTTTATGTVTIVTVSVGGGGYSAPAEADTTPPEIKNIQINDLTPFSAQLLFETDEPTVGFAEYGRASYDQSVGDSKFGTKHAIKLEGLRLGTLYQFRVKAVDKSGNTATQKGTDFTTRYFAEALKDLHTLDNAAQFQEEIEKSIESILPSLLPPFVEKPTVTDIGEDAATIGWRTNTESYSVVSYATEDDYDAAKTNPYTAEVSDITNKTTDHSLLLSGLIPNTKYHYVAKAFSLPQVIGKSPDLTFVTKAARIQARIVEVKNDSIRVVWTTQEPATSIVEVKNVKTNEATRRTDSAKKTYHEMVVDGLVPATKYEAYVSGINEKGNLIETTKGLPFVTSKDTTAPVIGSIKIESVFIPGKNKAQAIITWTTDEPATTVIYYGEGAGSELEEKGTKVDNGESWILNHVAIVSNLKPGTIYQVKLESSDPAGNRTVFGPRSIITPNQTESIFDVIFKNFEDAFKFLRNVK